MMNSTKAHLRSPHAASHSIRDSRFATRAFTLIELIVVVSIIVLLVGLLLPQLSKVREQARRTKCLVNLRSVGQGLAMYQLNESKGLLPYVRPLSDGNNTNDPGLIDVLQKYIDAPSPYRPTPDADWIVTDPYRCPSDMRGDAGSNFRPAWAVNGTSYEYPAGLLMLGLELATVPRERVAKAVTRLYDTEPKVKMVAMFDSDDWHNPRFDVNNRTGMAAEQRFDRNALFYRDMSAGKAEYLNNEEQARLVAEALRLGGLEDPPTLP